MKLFDVYPLYDVEIVKAQGSDVWDSNGQKYIDMYGGHAVISIGHTNPRYVQGITDQLNKIGFYSNSVKISLQQELADKLAILSGRNDYQLFLCNSGAEANENAMKLASFATGRKIIVAFSGSFHGRTSLAAAATDNPSITAPVNMTDNVVLLPFGDTKALQDYFAANGTNVAGVIIEGIQGVGGMAIASDEFLKTIRSLCDQYGAIYIADEIQCGCGRTGKYFAADWAGVDADIYTMAKGIGNGFPVAALLISPKIEAKHGMLGTTFGGNHLACAAAIAVADEMIEKNMMKQAAETGEYLMERLVKLPNVKEIRGRGLMIGIELYDDSAPVRNKLVYDEKIFVGSAKNKNMIRLLPALNISKKYCDKTVAALEKLIGE